MSNQPGILVERQSINYGSRDGGLASGTDRLIPAGGGAVSAVETLGAVSGGRTRLHNLAVATGAGNGNAEEGEE